jgi:hypothetical protein
MRQARSDRTAVYTSTPRPAGKASVPASSPPGAAPDRPAWTVEPGWSAYPQQPAPTAQPGAPGTSPGHDGLPGGSATEAAETSALAGALLGTGQAPTPPAGTRRTVLIVFLVLIVAAVVGASTAWFAGDAIGDLISKVTG